MFSCCFNGMRKFRLAWLLVSLIVSTHAAADSGDYRVRDQALSNGVRIVQRVDATAFPKFNGEHPRPSSVDAPNVGAGHLRAIRALVPLRGNNLAALSLPDGSSFLTVEIFNHHVLVKYGGSSVGPSTSPFWGADSDARWEGSANRRWSRTIATGPRVSRTATHYLVTLYIVPHFGQALPRERSPNLLLTVNEAGVQGMNVVRGRSLAHNVPLSVDDKDWSRWRESALRAGVVRDVDGGPLALPAAFTSRLPFLEQRTVDLQPDSTIRRRDRRCLTDIAYYMSNVLLPALLEIYFGRADLCTLDPHPNQDIAGALPLVEVANPEDIPRIPEAAVFEAAALDPSELNATAAYDAAMDVQFCNDDHARTAGDEACTDADRRAIAAIGDLRPLEIDELMHQIGRIFDPNRPGPGTLRTGNAELDQWLNADLLRAGNALNAAQAVVHVSDARYEPRAPIKNKKKKKRKLVKASCTEETRNDHPDNDPFQECVRKAKQRIGESESVFAVTPHLESNERHHARGTVEFERLTREFRNTRKGMPWGIAEDQFARFTAAIARDRAATGDNLGLVFINDPALRNGQDRFRYGVEHIWAPGGGGGDNAGHRDDWQGLKGLSVNSRDMLVQLIMAALTDPNARFTQTRTNNGNVVRTFEYFVFMRGNTPFAIRNVRIVLGQNGMVITAYPLRNASAESLQM
ncbi:MAG TPA: hypothetical protein VL635_03140 [Trinickia sp.]|nr:hypothetical protein [Trinickia sp.]